MTEGQVRPDFTTRQVRVLHRSRIRRVLARWHSMALVVAISVGAIAAGGARRGETSVVGGGRDRVDAQGTSDDGRAARELHREVARGPAAEATPGPPAPVARPRLRPGKANVAPFATYGPLRLRMPSKHVLLVAFHEASLPQALEMTPWGHVVLNDNPWRFTPPVKEHDTPYVVQTTRGRRQAPTSAVDLVLPESQVVRSVVSGTVTDVREYQLYGRYPDQRIEIQPDGHPDLRVVLIHLHGVRVAAGDRVEAARTVLADGARPFSFHSEVDNYSPTPAPHVHLEVKPAGSPAPGDPTPTAAPGG